MRSRHDLNALRNLLLSTAVNRRQSSISSSRLAMIRVCGGVVCSCGQQRVLCRGCNYGCPFGRRPAPLVAGAAKGDQAAIGELCELHRASLVRITQFRLDSKICRRVDAADVIQDAFIEATERFQKYLAQREDWPFFVWLRYLTLQNLRRSIVDISM